MITIENIKEKLSNIAYPGFTKSIVDFGFVKDIAVENNKAMIFVEITSSAEEVEKEIRDNITKELNILGISDVNITIKKPEAPKQMSNSMTGNNMTPQVKNFVMVSSGKGGVGKSTTSVNIAIALAMQGKKVGLLDADIYGPNIPRMMGLEHNEPEIIGNKIMPYKAYGVEVMSMGSLVEEGKALVWRGAMIQKAIQQLLRDILWSELDVLVIDMPPGTGDAQLTLAQSVPVAAGINVTTPQHVALDDSRRSLEMFTKLHIPIAGIIENMSGFVCPKCGEESDIFGKGTCDDLAREYNTKVLANIPIEPSIRVGGDDGKPVVYFYPDSKTGKKYLQAAQQLWESIEKSHQNGEIGNSDIQPNLPAGVSACSAEGQAYQKEQEAKKEALKASKSGCCGGGHCDS
ncbi:MAG: Mrp/NBP35 family ATP-binding protein [Arcobacteraceae bacterium]|jgi:ATP-binding protein involved in chromosome partitioning|nr:Mrp/NBP35 family ATP-binding protein [Arcobacteraceae bacterium]